MFEAGNVFGKLACQLEGIERIRIWHDQALYKEAWANPTSNLRACSYHLSKIKRLAFQVGTLMCLTGVLILSMPLAYGLLLTMQQIRYTVFSTVDCAIRYLYSVEWLYVLSTWESQDHQEGIKNEMFHLELPVPSKSFIIEGL